MVNTMPWDVALGIMCVCVCECGVVRHANTNHDGDPPKEVTQCQWHVLQRRTREVCCMGKVHHTNRHTRMHTHIHTHTQDNETHAKAE